jgi:hypothetical protein
MRMDKAIRPSATTGRRVAPKVDWRRKMSDHVAYALLVYTGLQIFVTMTVLKSGHGSALPYFALVVLIAAIIPGCRLFEKRWEGLSDMEAANPELADRFKRDRLAIWLCAIGMPLALTGLFLAIEELF